MLRAAPALVDVSAYKGLWCATNRVLVALGQDPVPTTGGLVTPPENFTAFLQGVDTVATVLGTQLLDTFAPLALQAAAVPSSPSARAWNALTQWQQQRNAIGLLLTATSTWQQLGFPQTWPDDLALLYTVAAEMLEAPGAANPCLTIIGAVTLGTFWPPPEGKAAWHAAHTAAVKQAQEDQQRQTAPPFFETRNGKIALGVGLVGLGSLVVWALRPRSA